ASPAGEVESAPLTVSIPAPVPAPAPVVAPEPAPSIQTEVAASSPVTHPRAARMAPPARQLRHQPYAAPFNSMSMFPAGTIPATRTNFVPRPPFFSRHPIASILLTVVLASIIGTAIFAFVSTSQTGEALIYYGQKAWKSLHTQSSSVSPN
ncbi:MAG: hypothetical protein ACRD4Y_16555, partial [Candidatus Acidiferrales bacterium]